MAIEAENSLDLGGSSDESSALDDSDSSCEECVVEDSKSLWAREDMVFGAMVVRARFAE
jgi:hypothetical protein